jgi:hypothetical protein
MHHRRLSRIAALSLAAVAVAAPTAVAQADDQPSATQSFVTPDARDAGQAASQAPAPDQIDRRTPDAKDAADGRGTFSAPEVTVVKLAQPAPTHSGGLDWGDAGIGAGAAAALLLIALGGTLAVVHHRHAPPRLPMA